MKKYLIISILFVFMGCKNSKDESKDYSSVNEYVYSEEQNKSKEKTDDVLYDGTEGAVSEGKDETNTKSTAPTNSDVTGETTNATETNSTSDDLTDTSYLNFKLTDKKIIKIASLKFEVQNVEKTTEIIEDLARKYDGYTSLSKLTSYQTNSDEIELSEDSVLRVYEYYVVNSMTIIVPKQNFDNILKELSKVYIYLDYREITTEDVSISFLRNKLKAINKLYYEERINNAVDKKGKNINDIVNAEQQASNLGEKAIDDKIANFTLQDKIDYSRITINMYQSASICNEKAKNTDLSVYKPPFFRSAYKSIKSGWDFMLQFFVLLLNLWPLILFVCIIIFGYKYFRKKGWISKKIEK